MKVLTKNIKRDHSPLDLKEYEANGGYRALRKTLNTFQPQEVTEQVKKSDLRGRGGAGFPTGQKWSFVPVGEDAPHPKYLVANADEMEPGTFKDRLLLETNPHQLIEGIIISAYALEAEVAFIFIRWAYKSATKILEKTVHEAEQAGYLGKNILNSGYSLEIHIHSSVGRYMCGEETGLLNALEGRRAVPRDKPPYPQASGLWGKPTIVNNVETLSCIPHIMENGAQWFKDLSHTKDSGTKLYGVSGKVKRPGLWELPLGTSMDEIIHEHAGGMQKGTSFRGALPGGASTDFLTADHFNVPLDFTHVQNVGSRLGTGTLIVLDDQTCPVGFVHNLQHFFAQESCGWCTPCREGLPWVEKLLYHIEQGQGKSGDLDLLAMHPKLLAPGNTFCALAPGAMEPLQSALKYFQDDFQRHITEQRCPWRK